MNAARRERLEALLWPPGGAAARSVWAVLDLAREPAVRATLVDSRLEWLCLYEGRLPRELEAVAPHIVELQPGHRLTGRLLDDGWGRSWGVMLAIDDATRLRRHLRRFLTVRDEAGRSLLFRYYDPRVLRAYLPTCTTDELATVFGPVERWVVEGEAGTVAHEFRFDGQRLQARTEALA